MNFSKVIATAMFGGLLATAACSAAPDDPTGSATSETSAAQAYVDSINGLSTINGLPVVDPDGILSSTTGMMASVQGVMTAKYMVQCALPAGTSVTVTAGANSGVPGAPTTVTLSGAIGLAPSWATGSCNATCQEQISSCLMAYTNGQGNHVNIEMSSQLASVGNTNSSAYPYQEASFFGNIFTSPPQAFYCVGKDYISVQNNSGLFPGTVSPALDMRACGGWAATTGPTSCPYVDVGTCNQTNSSLLGAVTGTLFGSNGSPPMCSFTKSAASACGSKAPTYFLLGYTNLSTVETWKNPVTTYRMDKGAT